MLAGDTDRERVEVALREHYVGGRLTLEEFTDRAGRVLAARSRVELRGALSGLPALPDVDDIATPIRSAARVAIRGALLVVATGAYLLFSVTAARPRARVAFRSRVSRRRRCVPRDLARADGSAHPALARAPRRRASI